MRSSPVHSGSFSVPTFPETSHGYSWYHSLFFILECLLMTLSSCDSLPIIKMSYYFSQTLMVSSTLNCISCYLWPIAGWELWDVHSFPSPSMSESHPPFLYPPYAFFFHKKSHCRLPLPKKNAFSQRNLHLSYWSQNILLCPSCWLRMLLSLTYILPLPKKEVYFFPLLATLREVHYCVPGVLVLKAYCENCSKQNSQHQDTRNRIQGWNYLPRVDVTAAPFNPGWYNSSS